mgnify:CR=1 FL=1
MYNCHAETSYCTPHGNYTLFIIHYKINSSFGFSKCALKGQ